jgi:hypothetical protein
LLDITLGIAPKKHNAFFRSDCFASAKRQAIGIFRSPRRSTSAALFQQSSADDCLSEASNLTDFAEVTI